MALYVYNPEDPKRLASVPTLKPTALPRMLRAGDTFEADFEGVADAIKAINGRIPGAGGKPAISKVAVPKASKAAK